MKNLVVFAPLIVLLHGSALSACRLYDLPSRSSIMVEGTPVVRADRVDILATDGSCDSPVSPFKIIGYDKDCNVIFDRMFVRDNDSTNELVSLSSQLGLAPTVVQDELYFCDGFYSLSAKKLHGEFLINVLDMCMCRDGSLDSRVCTNKQSRAPVSVAWPKADENRQFYYHRELQTLDLLRIRGTSHAKKEYLYLNCAVYQKGANFSIRFLLSRMKGGCQPIAEGRVVGDIVGDKIMNKSVVYCFGEGLAVADVGLMPADGPEEAVVSEHEKAPLERAGLKHRTVRLNVVYGAMKIQMDMRALVDCPY